MGRARRQNSAEVTTRPRREVRSDRPPAGFAP
jgi:hypothetical protein